MSSLARHLAVIIVFTGEGCVVAVTCLTVVVLCYLADSRSSCPCDLPTSRVCSVSLSGHTVPRVCAFSLRCRYSPLATARVCSFSFSGYTVSSFAGLYILLHNLVGLYSTLVVSLHTTWPAPACNFKTFLLSYSSVCGSVYYLYLFWPFFCGKVARYGSVFVSCALALVVKQARIGSVC